MLRFAEVEGGDIKLTETACLRRRRIPMSASRSSRATCSTTCRSPPISAACSMSAPHCAPKSRFFDELEDYMGEDDAEQTLRAVIAWRATRKFSPTTTTGNLPVLENPT